MKFHHSSIQYVMISVWFAQESHIVLGLHLMSTMRFQRVQPAQTNKHEKSRWNCFSLQKKKIIWSFLRLTKAAVIEGKKNNICLWDSCSESLFFTEPMWSITVNKLIDYYYSWAIWHTSLFLNAQIKLSNNLDEDDGTMREKECSSEGGKWIFLFYDWIDTNVSFMHGNDSWFNIPVIVIISI